jgi:hypothetical protein
MAPTTRKNIRVATIFEPGGTIQPVWFELNRQKHRVSKTVYRWGERLGAATLLHFAVSDEVNLFELTYNTAEHSWQLTAIDDAAL